MNRVSIIVRADWDDEAQVWVATSNDIDGLAVEAETMEQLRKKIEDAICDLAAANGIGHDLPEIPIHIMAEQLSRIPNPCH